MPVENRDMGTLRNVNPYGLRTLYQIITFKGLTKPPDLNSDDRIGSGIEGRTPKQTLGGDVISLELVTPAGKRLFHQERQEPFQTS